MYHDGEIVIYDQKTVIEAFMRLCSSERGIVRLKSSGCRASLSATHVTRLGSGNLAMFFFTPVGHCMVAGTGA